jgi:hypothetical protein
MPKNILTSYTFSTGGNTITSHSASIIPLTITGASSQTADLLLLRNNGGTTQFRVDPNGMTIANSLGVAGSPSGISYAYFTTPSASAKPVVVRGAASQSANLQEWQNSAGTVLASVNSAGDIGTSAAVLAGTSSWFSATSNIKTLNAGIIGQVIRATSSQTANLSEWQDSAGTRQGYVSAGGNTLTFPGITAAYSFFAQSGGVSVVPVTVRGVASQTANLQEWQNSAGTRLSSIASNGLPYLSSTSSANIDTYTEAANDMALMLPDDAWDDKLRFLYGLYERSTDGTTAWTVNTFDPAIVDGRMDTIMSLPTASLGHRFTWFTTNFQYMTPRYLRLSSGYPGATNSTISVLIESSANNSTWTSRGSYTGISAGIMKRLLRISDNGDHSYIRVTITYTTVSTAMQLENVELLTYRPGNQGGNLAGAESRLPISSWDGNRTNVVQASHSGAVSQIVKGGFIRTATINGAVGNGTTVTFTTSTPHVLRVGQSVTLTGVNPGAYNISGTIASVTGMSGFTITNAATGTYVSGGTATVTTLANPFEVHNAAGTTVARIDTTGTLVISGIGVTSGDHRVGTSSYFSAALNVLARATTEKGVVVRGQASQTANLQEWQDSSANILSYVKPNGTIFINATNNTAGIEFPASTGTNIIRANGNDINMSPRFDVIHSPADSSGRLRPASDNTSDLGTSGQRWRNIYGAGAILNGLTLSSTTSPITLNGSVGTSGQVLTSAGAGATPTWTTVSGGGSFTGGTLTSGLVLATGTTTLQPLKFVAGTNLTTPVTGVKEYDGTVFYSTSNTNPGRALETQSYYYVSDSDFYIDFSGSGASQSMFGGPTTGLTVAAGTTYEFELDAAVQHQYQVNAGITGTFAMQNTGGATVAVTNFIDYGSNTTGFTTATTMSSIRNTAGVTFMTAISSGSRYGIIRVRGILRVTGSGTTKVYPGLAASSTNDNTWIVASGAVFKMTPIGNGTVTTVGTWA